MQKTKRKNVCNITQEWLGGMVGQIIYSSPHITLIRTSSYVLDNLCSWREKKERESAIYYEISLDLYYILGEYDHGKLVPYPRSLGSFNIKWCRELYWFLLFLFPGSKLNFMYTSRHLRSGFSYTLSRIKDQVSQTFVELKYDMLITSEMKSTGNVCSINKLHNIKYLGLFLVLTFAKIWRYQGYPK